MKISKYWIVLVGLIIAVAVAFSIRLKTAAEKTPDVPTVEVRGEKTEKQLEVEDRFTEPPTYELVEVDIAEQNYYDSLEILAICVEAEAGNQDLYGRRLVTDVILNRVDSDRFPDSIEEVISQPYQFETYWNGAMDRVVEPSEDTFKAVQMELESRTDREILFFTYEGYNKYCKPAYKYGDHYFGY